MSDYYAARIRGYITPPVTGFYTLWAAGDDHIEVSLSTDSSKQQTRPIIKNVYWTNSLSFDQYPSQRSVPVFLQAGEHYYLEALHKEFAGGDHFSLAWAMQSLDPNSVEKNWASPAFGAVASSSTTYSSSYSASKGIDHNPATFFHTTNLENQWWMVDLGQERHIHRVEIINRQDCCQARASNFRGELLDANQQVITYKDFYVENGNMASAETWLLERPFVAKFVRFRSLGVNRAGNYILHFAEVQAYGQDVTPQLSPRELIPASALHAYTSLGSDDEDDDGFPDAWESTHGFPTGYNTGNFAAFADPDLDGYPNIEEARNGMNPFVADHLPRHLTHQAWLTGLTHFE